MSKVYFFFNLKTSTLLFSFCPAAFELKLSSISHKTNPPKSLLFFRPRFFSNRDYVCGRRAQVYEDEKLIVIYSKSTDHSTCPQK